MATLAHPTITQLRAIDLFQDLSDEELERWTITATLHEADAGTRVMESGDDPQVLLLLSGTLDLLARDGEVEARQNVQTAPTWIGVISSLMGNPSVVSMVAQTPVTYASLGSEEFLDLVFAHRVVFRRALAAMKPMMLRLAQRQHQRERLEALGTMAAGLAHELNNPASAARQAARDLTESLATLSETVEVFVQSGIDREQAGRLVALHAAALKRCAEQTTLSALDRADREDALGDVLSELGIPEPWTVAATFAAGGMEPPELRHIAEVAGPLAVPVVRWIAASLAARQLAAELSDSTARMSDLVKAIKKYAYAKPGEVTEVDLRDGIETTLTLMQHKLKHTSITVRRDYDESLGTVAVYSSELNQVWTNLLDNAIDALGDSGEITITTRRDGDCAEVDIADDGPGIPHDVQRRVFDPFFTTKDVGKGTGLGLDAARRIIADRHHGSLTVQSTTTPPTGTVFRARFPLDAARR